VRIMPLGPSARFSCELLDGGTSLKIAVLVDDEVRQVPGPIQLSHALLGSMPERVHAGTQWTLRFRQISLDPTDLF